MNFVKPFLAAGAFALLGTTAGAATIDFTDSSTFTFSPDAITGTAGTGTFTLTGSGDLTLGPDGPGPVGDLLGGNDGVGVVDDEVTFPGQSVTLTFSDAVEITGLYFLDLFQAPDLSDSEAVDVSADGGLVSASFAAQTPLLSPAVGFGSFDGLSIFGTSFTFSAQAGNDLAAMPDFSLAGVEFDFAGVVAPIPLPAGVLLLGAALGGLGFAGRRRKSA